MEKRTAGRSSTEIPVACSRFSIIDGAAMHEGIMLNCSSAGSYIELDQHIDEGTIVMLKSHDTPQACMPASLPEGYRSVSLAEVRWARVIEDDTMCRFGLGLKYFNL